MRILTFSFFSVSDLREAERVSRVSPLRATGGGETLPFKEALRAAAPFKEADTRGEAAERAVAPREIEDAG